MALSNDHNIYCAKSSSGIFRFLKLDFRSHKALTWPCDKLQYANHIRLVGTEKIHYILPVTEDNQLTSDIVNDI